MGTEGNSPGLPAGRKGRGPRPLPPLAYQLLKKASLRLLGVVRDACACTADGKLPSMQAARVTSNSLLRAAGFGRPVAIALLGLLCVMGCSSTGSRGSRHSKCVMLCCQSCTGRAVWHRRSRYKDGMFFTLMFILRRCRTAWDCLSTAAACRSSELPWQAANSMHRLAANNQSQLIFASCKLRQHLTLLRRLLLTSVAIVGNPPFAVGVCVCGLILDQDMCRLIDPVQMHRTVCLIYTASMGRGLPPWDCLQRSCSCRAARSGAPEDPQTSYDTGGTGHAATCLRVDRFLADNLPCYATTMGNQHEGASHCTTRYGLLCGRGTGIYFACTPAPRLLLCMTKCVVIEPQ